MLNTPSSLAGVCLDFSFSEDSSPESDQDMFNPPTTSVQNKLSTYQKPREYGKNY